MIKLNPNAASSPNIQNWPITTQVKGDELYIGGCSVSALAKEFGTPLYVIDEDTFRTIAKTYNNSFKAHYGDNFGVLYASKALNNMALCKMAHQEGLYLDTVSGGELFTALKAGFPAEKIFFHGNNKSIQELTEALEANIGHIVVDNFDELSLLIKIAKEKNKKANIMMRVTPGISAHTHDFIKTGQEDSKFGFDIKKQIFDAIEIAKESGAINLLGLHAHIGSQIFDLHSFEAEANIMLELYQAIRTKYDIELHELDLGGGLGIQYTQSDTPPMIEEYAKVMSNAVKKASESLNLPLPKIFCEPGRSMIATAGVTVYTIGSKKQVPNGRTYVAIDGGMADNARPITYGAVYEAAVANKAAEVPDTHYTIAGKCCESGDILIQEIELPPVEAGDILAVCATGAYNYSMASNYNRLGKPAMILVRNCKARLIMKREDYSDIVRNDLIPADM